MNIVAIVLESLLALLFFTAGGDRIAALASHVKNVRRCGDPQALRPGTGASEITGALGLITGLFVHWVAPLTALWRPCDMGSALATHTRICDAPPGTLRQRRCCATR